jgi:hypothetical protein
MIRKLTAAKAVAAAIGAAGVIFNRGNADVAAVAVLVFAVLVLAIETIANRHRGLIGAINLVGLVLTTTFASLMFRLPEPFDRFYVLVLIVTFIQLLAETAINFGNRWFNRGNIDHIINWSLHLIIWSLFIWVNLDPIGAIGIFGTYCGILAVHWGIEAAGPKPLKED